MKLLWEERGWEDYCWWQQQDKKTLKKINELIKGIQRDPFGGIGLPEPLKNELSGWWSRRINEKDRIVYTVRDDVVIIACCKGHYES